MKNDPGRQLFVVKLLQPFATDSGLLPYRTAGRNVGALGMLLGWDGLSNEWKEFWPDIRRVFHKQNP